MKYEKGSFITVPNQEHLCGQPPESQCLFMWMCFFANQKGECFPSYQTLSKMTGMSKTSIKKYIQYLVDLGVLEKENRKDGKKNKTNLYAIIIEGVGREATQVGREATEGVGRQVSGELNPYSLTQSTEDRLTQKMKDFEDQLMKAIYPKQPTGQEAGELKKFYLYWTEPNKSRTKLKWEMERTWDIKRRLRTWMINSVKFNGGSQNNKYKAVSI